MVRLVNSVVPVLPRGLELGQGLKTALSSNSQFVPHVVLDVPPM